MIVPTKWKQLPMVIWGPGILINPHVKRRGQSVVGLLELGIERTQEHADMRSKLQGLGNRCQAPLQWCQVAARFVQAWMLSQPVLRDCSLADGQRPQSSTTSTI